MNALFILLLPVGLALKIPFFLHSRGLHPLRWPTIRRYSQCLEPVVVVPPSLEKYRHFSQVLLLFLLISASVNSDQLFFMASPSHDMIEILYVSGVYQVFLSVWVFSVQMRLYVTAPIPV